MEFVKLYDWIADTGLGPEERIIFALINQFTEDGGDGYWGGYLTMSARTGIPKLQCRRITENLVKLGAVEKSNKTEYRKTRLVLKSRPEFVAEFSW